MILGKFGNDDSRLSWVFYLYKYFKYIILIWFFFFELILYKKGWL